MPYKVYDKKKKMYVFDGEQFSLKRDANYSIIFAIRGSGHSDSDMNRAVYYFENFVVKKVVAKKPVKKPAKKK